MDVFARIIRELARTEPGPSPLGSHLTNLLDYRDEMRSFRRGVKTAPPWTLKECYTYLAELRNCKEPRDRIYGMLEMCSDSDIVPDYAIPVEKLHMNYVDGFENDYMIRRTVD